MEVFLSQKHLPFYLCNKATPYCTSKLDFPLFGEVMPHNLWGVLSTTTAHLFLSVKVQEHQASRAEQLSERSAILRFHHSLLRGHRPVDEHSRFNQSHNAMHIAPHNLGMRHGLIYKTSPIITVLWQNL